VPLVEKEISASLGGVVGTRPESILMLDDVSVALGPQVCPFDATVSIRRIRNPREYATNVLRVYDFGPSFLTFAHPVTITIPYTVRISGKTRACWFDSATSAFTEDGITNVQDITLGSRLHALQFNAAHFTPYGVTSGPRVRGHVPSGPTALRARD
jgi:hypothetical protein